MVTDEKVIVKDQGLAERSAVLAPRLRRGAVEAARAAPAMGRNESLGAAPDDLVSMCDYHLPVVILRLTERDFGDGTPGKGPQLCDEDLTSALWGEKVDKARRSALGLAIVAAGMMPLFFLPKDDFALSTFIATGCMAAVAVASGGYRRLFAPRVWTLGVGAVSAAGLYALFYAGNLAVVAFHPLGVGAQAETSIYALIASSGNLLPLQVLVLACDSVGFESYFRGTLQSLAAPRLGPAAPFAVAAVDALIHAASFNILWVVATFLADSVWGLTYYRTGDLSSSMLSHFAWDVAIFMVAPIG
ncbi:MAG: CPBP family intramembrane metalloprotease [Nitrososphaerota archaeon]|jgi:membrane protease YdiL (CAAX protease family)|nr:CPBP family intramembrane metalloprotease [Nitrososphaerota archaeon]MCL5672741.1 CPBP family intramembrane metalloprotease [Nitrososphaerota archaeon]MDG6945465.1 CPBP family intramembrane metalloprotease [Nitrososphaerota archaeon]MDG6952067.1 CPBP family intramembrane metalloprotease [Nitrososphaerota archaeon]MDG6970225.1 CPBP family intramembrane metalloprotease [Nitrososphaerota archaeon]